MFICHPVTSVALLSLSLSHPLRVNIFVLSPTEGDLNVVNLANPVEILNACCDGSLGVAANIDIDVRFTGGLLLLSWPIINCWSVHELACRAA